ncbi:gluconokinase [Pseudoduganella aquatica]|nr:gluconokinase [Pseudoduganella aquatica]
MTEKTKSTRWVVMGVCGCGKSSVGGRLAESLGAKFLEGDAFHSPANVAKMSAGTPLTDADRAEWLLQLMAEIRNARETGASLVLSCSALKRRYRDLLREGDPELRFAHLAGDRELIANRMLARINHYMPLSLLDSQLNVLEPLQADEAGITLDIRKEPAQLITDILNSNP